MIFRPLRCKRFIDCGVDVRVDALSWRPQPAQVLSRQAWACW